MRTPTRVRPAPAAGRTGREHRFVRYCAVSVVGLGLAQAGLAIGYGLLHWPLFGSVLLSLAVSVLPSYVLSRRFVWAGDLDATKARARVLGFCAVAVAGSLATVGAATVVLDLAHQLIADRAVATLLVNASSLAVSVAVWLARFWLLNTVVFGAGSVRRWSSPAALDLTP